MNSDTRYWRKLISSPSFQMFYGLVEHVGKAILTAQNVALHYVQQKQYRKF